jgi:phage N-6-adenine-methyltransferase
MWETPQDFFDRLNAVYAFTTDVCAIKANAKCKYFYTPVIDGLQQTWKGNCWMNPPYGRNQTGKWVEKAYRESKNGCLVVALLPARTDTRWFHRFIYKKRDVTVEFIKGRLKFGGSKNAAPFPSMVVIFQASAA